MIWILLAVIIALIIIAFLRIEHISKLIILTIILIILSFFVFSFNKMLKSGEISFDSPKSAINSFVVYGRWVENRTSQVINFGKRGVGFVGDAIKS